MPINDPVKTLQQLFDTPAGTEPWFQDWQDFISWLSNINADVSALSGGGAPDFGGAIDLRWYLADTASSGTVYAGSPNNSPDPADSITKGQSYIFVPNTDAAGGVTTLDIGSTEGAVNIKVLKASGKINPKTYQMLADNAYILYFDGTDWLLLNPQPINVMTYRIVGSKASVTTGDGKGEPLFIPYEIGGADLKDVGLWVDTAGTDSGSGTADIQIHNLSLAQDILSTKLKVASAATADDGNAVINATYKTLAANTKLRFDVDSEHDTTIMKGLTIRLVIV